MTISSRSVPIRDNKLVLIIRSAPIRVIVKADRQTGLDLKNTPLGLQTENINGTTLLTGCAHPISYQVQYGSPAVKYVEPHAGTKGGSRYWNKRVDVRQPGAEGSNLGGKASENLLPSEKGGVKEAEIERIARPPTPAELPESRWRRPFRTCHA